MAFTNSTDSNGVTVISVTGEELLGEDVNDGLLTDPGVPSAIDIILTKGNFSNSGQLGVTLTGFSGTQLTTDTNITSMRIQNDTTGGFFFPSGIPGRMNVFPGNRSGITTSEAFVDGMVELFNNPDAAAFQPQAADYLLFTAQKVNNTATTVTLRLLSKTGGLWATLTLSDLSNQPAITNTASSVSNSGSAPFTRTGVSHVAQGGRHIYTFTNTTRLQIGNTVANADGTTSTITASGILNHNTEKSVLIFERLLSLASSQTQNYAVVTAQAASVDQSIDPSVYNFGIQTSSTSGPKVVTTTGQSFSIGDIALVPQNGGQSDNKRFQNKVADTSVTLSTTFTNTTNWTALSDSPVVFSDGLGIYFTNPRTGSDGSPNFNWWYGGGQNGVYGGTSGHFMGASAHHIEGKGGIININGGRIGGKFSLGLGNNATLRNYSNAKFLVDDQGQPAGTEWVARVTGLANIDTREFTMVGGSISFVVSFGNYNSVSANENVGTTTASLQRENGGIALWNQSLLNMPNTVLKESYMTFRNPNFINNVVDIAPYQTSNNEFSGTRVQNCVQGSALNINGGETTSSSTRMANSNHYVIGTRQIDTNVRATSDDTLQTGAIYGIDTNRNTNLASPVSTINGNSYSDTDGYVYFGKFTTADNITEWDVTGAAGNTTNALGAKLMSNSGDNEIALFTYSLTRADRPRANQDEGIWRKNIRGLGDAGSATQDDFELDFWMYENLYQRLTTNFTGANVKSLELKTAPDPLISDTRAAITTKNSGAQGTGMTLTDTSVTTTTSAYTLDEIYDLVKIKKEQSLAAIQIPSVTTLLLNPVNGTIPFGDISITQGTGLWSVGTKHTAVSQNTILNAGSFVLNGGIELTAPTITNLPTMVGTSTLNPTFNMASTGNHTITSGSVINGTLVPSGNGNTFGGTVNGLLLLSGTDGAANTFSGTVTGFLTVTGSGTQTFSGTFGNNINVVNGSFNSTAEFTQTSGTISATLSSLASKPHVVNGTTGGNVTFGNGATTVNAVIPGNFVAATGAHTFNTGTNISGTTTVGRGPLTLRGTYGDKVTSLSSPFTYDVDATITAGGLELGALDSGTITVQGEIVGPVILGNAPATFDASVVGNVSLGNGASVLNSVVTGDVSHGTGTFTIGSSSLITGKFTKNGSGEPNRLTVAAGADVSKVDLVIPSGTLEVFGAVNGSFKSVTGLADFNATTTTTSFQVGSGLPSGRVLFKDRAAAAGTYIMDVTHTEGTTTALGTFNNNIDNPTEYDIYYKPTNTFGSDGIFWTTTIVNSDNSSAADRTIDVTAVRHAGVLTRAAEDADLTGLTATMSTVTTGLTANINMSGAIAQITSAQTQSLLLRVTDDVNYLNLLANNNAEGDYILPNIQSGSTIDQSKFTLQATQQQSITALVPSGSGTLIGTITIGGITFAAVFIFPNPLGLSVDEARLACVQALDINALTKDNVDGIIAQNTTIPATNQADLDARELTKANVDGIIAQNTTIPKANQDDLDDRRVTRENMNNLGILAPINDTDPS